MDNGDRHVGFVIFFAWQNDLENPSKELQSQAILKPMLCLISSLSR
jgi:hypothetical protein